MKKVFFIFLIVTNVVFAQNLQKDDIILPTKSSIISSNDISKAVNESTGKLQTTFPIATITARSIVFPVELSYDGANVHKQASFRNRYIPTSTVGVGWSLNLPKIVADTKMTAARDDDSFFLNGIELVCTNKPLNPTTQSNVGVKVWEFKAKKQLPYIIKFYQYFQINTVPPPADYWQVIDDKGNIYNYGKSANSRENLLAWGNWIGDSKQSAYAKEHCIVWNVNTLSDQWGNTLTFTYLKEEQGVASTGPKHTEASYIQQISSSTGERIVFEYGNKGTNEYYEPNTEVAEPDAYQERYEKKFLNSIKVYNSSNELETNHNLNYVVIIPTLDGKRYLNDITVINKNNNALPPYQFHYDFGGEFMGFLTKILYPEGGSVTYNYTTKALFTNNNQHVQVGSFATNGSQYASYKGDKYKLSLKTTSSFPNTSQGRGEGTFFIIRDSWTGRNWKSERFNIPGSIGVFYDYNNAPKLDNAKFIFEDDFYAVLTYNESADTGNLYVFHLLEDGSWNYTSRTNIDLGDGDPTLLSSDEFVVVGTKKNGKLTTLYWNGIGWNYKLIDQGSGEYYYGVNNNFLIAMNHYTGTDMSSVINTPVYAYDRYYIHYLDAEKKWLTKSWTATATATIGDISSQSYFYPSYAMTSFVAGSNPEFILRWDSEYNLQSVDPGILGQQNDNYPNFPIVNNIFTGYRIGDIGRPYIFKLIGFDGVNWATVDYEMETINGFGKNRIVGLAFGAAHYLFTYNPNTSFFSTQALTFDLYSPPGAQFYKSHYIDSYAFANNIFMAGKRVYKINNNGLDSGTIVGNYIYSEYVKPGGGEYIYANFWSPNGTDKIGESRYFYLDKTDDSLQSIIVNSGYTNPGGFGGPNRSAEQFGGKFPFYTSKNMDGRHLIDNRYGNVVTDAVLSEIVADNGMGNIRKITYDYNAASSNTLGDDVTVIYSEVNIVEAGNGTGLTNGKTRRLYDNGATDVTRAGLLTKTELYNHSNLKVLDEINTYSKSTYSITNSGGQAIQYNIVWNITQKEEKSTGISTITNFNYDNYGNILYTSRINSKGDTESTTITYANAVYPFVAAKNFHGVVHKKENRLNNQVVSVDKLNWIENNGKVYISENLGGTSEANLRVNSAITTVDSYGNIVETSNGRGVSKSIIMGYNYKHAVATIENITHAEIIASLDVPYSSLQSMSTAALKTELVKLYTDFPSNKVIIELYDASGKLVTLIDQRRNETNYIYDEFGRIQHITDKSGNIIESKIYNYGN